jgi:uncharacterized protein YndB with AHSA1/START domain
MEVRDDNGLIREMTVTRLLRAPIDIVWEIWTDPGHIQQWWGPHGFSAPLCRWDAKTGNDMYLEMKGPTGIIIPVKGEFVEVVKPTRLVFKTHKLDNNGKPEVIIVHSITLSAEGRKTRFELHMKVDLLTESGKIALSGVKVGLTQQLDKMETHLYSQQ